MNSRSWLVTVDTGAADLYRTFCLIYNQMRKRKTFETTVDVEEFGRIQQDLPESHRMQVLVCEDKGVPVAGLVASAMGDSAIYLLGATSDDGLKSKGAYLLQWTMIKWLKEHGVRWYDLGGIDPEGNPGVYSFKKGLSGIDVTQLSPLVACDSVASSAMVRAGLAMRRAVRVCKECITFYPPCKPRSKQDLGSIPVPIHIHGYLRCHCRLECQALLKVMPGKSGKIAAPPQHGDPGC